MRLLTLSSPEDRANDASDPETRTSSSSSGIGPSARNQASQPLKNDPIRLKLSRRVPSGPLLRNAASQAANVLQERREGVLLGVSDSTASSGFDWASSSYDRRSRGIRIWLYAIDLRVSLALLDKKWSYLLGMNSCSRPMQAPLYGPRSH